MGAAGEALQGFADDGAEGLDGIGRFHRVAGRLVSLGDLVLLTGNKDEDFDGFTFKINQLLRPYDVIPVISI